MLLSQFPLTFHHCIASDYSCADWDGLLYHLRDVPPGDIFNLGNFAAARVYITQRKYKVKPHSSPWFSAAFAAVTVHRNHFFICTKRINLLIQTD